MRIISCCCLRSRVSNDFKGKQVQRQTDRNENIVPPPQETAPQKEVHKNIAPPDQTNGDTIVTSALFLDLHTIPEE